MKNSRQIAFEILNKIQKDNSYSNLLLDCVLDENKLSVQDRKFTSALVYGVIERSITLDYQLSLYLTQPLKKLKPQVLTILRMGVYQLLFMDKVPDSAAVNECIKLSKKNQAQFASGLINAVLRKVRDNGLKLPNITDINYLSIKYSSPLWLCQMWSNAYGKDNAEALLAETIGSTDTYLRENNNLITKEKLVDELNEQGYFAENKNGYIKANGSVHKSKVFSDGHFHIQDIASQLCCKAVNPQKNDRILDVCAAPGGKTFTISELLEQTGEVVSCDIHAHRVELIKKGASRLKLTNITAIQNDASVYNNSLGEFDKVLCDVPCSGLGVIRKKPEIKYKSPQEVDKLPDLQYSILVQASNYVKNGGILIYSTCSLNPDENEKNVEKFLCENKNFESIKILDELMRYGDDTDYVTLMPHIHNCDGFFIAAFKRIG